MAEALIDLDVRGPLPADDPPRPTRLRWSRVRPVLAGAVVLAVTFAVGGAAPPAPARFGDPVRIPGDGFLLTDDAVLVEGDGQLRSHHLDGRLRWALPSPLSESTPSGVAGDLVLMSTHSWPRLTVALDRDTGAVRWRAEGSVLAADENQVVLGLGEVPRAELEPITAVVAVHTSDGRPRWRESLALAGTQRLILVHREFLLGLRATQVFQVDAAGNGRSLELRTGRWRPVSGVPAIAAGDKHYPEYAMEVHDVIIMSSNPIAQRDRLAVFGVASSTPLWSVDAEAGSAQPCGPWICLNAGTRTRILDRLTGALIRTIDWPYLTGSDPNRLLGAGTYGSGAGTALVDGTTGTVRRVYPRWELVSGHRSEWVPMIRPTGAQSWELATLSLATGVAHRLGDLRSWRERLCQATDALVGCTTADQVTGRTEVVLWRFVPARG